MRPLPMFSLVFFVVVSIAGCGSMPVRTMADASVCTTTCSGHCVDVNTDANNCGACATVCGTGKHCVLGICACAGCATAVDCDDRIACTVDSCVMGVCHHQPQSMMCSAGQFCVLIKGCLKGKACGNVGDCSDVDACKVNRGCDAATSTCTYEVLDKDGDGHPPVVCGGDDCDDSDPARFPGNCEICDGKDNGCTGKVDVGATCASKFRSCNSGMCTCKMASTCGGRCADSDVANCGMCGNKCPTGGACTEGVCQCPMGQTSCSGVCADLTRASANCGKCGTDCGMFGQCSSSVCSCQFGSTMCSGVCSNVQIDPANCGMCDNACSMGALCTKGLCQLTCDGLIACTNACMGDGPCYTACMKRATTMGRNLWDALGNCVNNACPGNNFGDPCYTPTSALCMKCWQTAQNKGGACAQALTDCHSDV